MRNLTGLPHGAVIIGATIAFAGVAWQAGTPREPAPVCDNIRVVEYLAVPQIEPILKTPPLGWPIEYRQRADDAPAVEQAVAKDDDAVEAPRRHYRRRHWRRR